MNNFQTSTTHSDPSSSQTVPSSKVTNNRPLLSVLGQHGRESTSAPPSPQRKKAKQTAVDFFKKVTNKLSKKKDNSSGNSPSEQANPSPPTLVSPVQSPRIRFDTSASSTPTHQTPPKFQNRRWSIHHPPRAQIKMTNSQERMRSKSHEDSLEFTLAHLVNTLKRHLIPHKKEQPSETSHLKDHERIIRSSSSDSSLLKLQQQSSANSPPSDTLPQPTNVIHWNCLVHPPGESEDLSSLNMSQFEKLTSPTAGPIPHNSTNNVESNPIFPSFSTASKIEANTSYSLSSSNSVADPQYNSASQTDNRKKYSSNSSSAADIHPRCPVVEDKQKRCTTTIKRIDNSGEKSNFGGFSNTMNIPKKKSEDDFYMEDSSLTDDGNLRSITNSTRHVMSDEDGVIISSSPTIKPRVSTGQIQEEILDPILDFFKQNTNYDLMPYSGKVIVFDIDLPVREAFQVAANNDISFASLWDSEKSCLVGMLTVTDLIDILLLFHNQMDVIQDLVTHKTIREWRAMQKRTRPDKLIYVTPEDTLLTAIHTLSTYSIHRLPVLSPKGALLHIITHSHLLAYLVSNLKFESPIFQYSLEDLGIGTYTNVVTAKLEMQLFAAVCLFAKYKVSAIPVVNEEGCVVDVFSRYDIVYFVRDGDYRLEMTLGDALRTRPRIPVFTCTKAESFEKVLRHLSTTRIHRLVCVDEYSRVVGIVSISDIFSFLMKKQEEITLSREQRENDLLDASAGMEDDN